MSYYMTNFSISTKKVRLIDKYSAECIMHGLSGRNPVTETETELTLKLVNVEKLDEGGLIF